MVNFKIFNILFLLIFLLLIIIDVSLFFVGFHSLDMGHNMLLLEKDNIKLTDYTLKYSEKDGLYLYTHGINIMIKSFMSIIFASLGFGMVLFEIFNNTNSKNTIIVNQKIPMKTYYNSLYGKISKCQIKH